MSDSDRTFARRMRVRFVGAPAAAGIALVGVASALGASGAGADFPAFLSALTGGWALAFAVVNALDDVAGGRAWLIHLGLGALAVAVLVSIDPLLRSLADLPAALRGPLSAAALAIPPACGWVLLTLLGRVTDRTQRTAARRAATMPHLTWGDDPAYPRLTVLAARMTTGRLSALILGAVVTGGAAIVVLLVAGERWVTRLAPLLLILVLGIVVALPLSALVRAVVRVHRVQLSLGWTHGALEVQVSDPRALGAEPPDTRTLPLSALVAFVWRDGGDTARVELHTAHRHEVFLVGMLRQDGGASSELPALTATMNRALENAGLVRSERRGVVRFRRPDHATAEPKESTAPTRPGGDARSDRG